MQKLNRVIEISMKKVSVIIPCYNQGKYLKETVDSVLNSTYKDIELIIVNDGSDDDITKSVLKELEKQGINIINIENSGVCAARNNGIIKATGEYILPLDADDKIAPEYIEKAVDILNKDKNIGIVYCKAKFFGSNNKPVPLKPATIYNMLIQNCIFSASLFRKEQFLLIGGFCQKLEIGCEDWDFWLSIIETGAKVYQISEVLFYYRKAENSRTQKSLLPENYIKIRLSIIKRHKKLYDKYALFVYPALAFMAVKNFLSYIFKLLRGKN